MAEWEVVEVQCSPAPVAAVAAAAAAAAWAALAAATAAAAAAAADAAAADERDQTGWGCTGGRSALAAPGKEARFLSVVFL